MIDCQLIAARKTEQACGKSIQLLIEFLLLSRAQLFAFAIMTTGAGRGRIYSKNLLQLLLALKTVFLFLLEPTRRDYKSFALLDFS